MNLRDFLSNLFGASGRPMITLTPLEHSSLFPGEVKPDDIKTYPLNDIMKSGQFTPGERRQEYRRRGKSPSGVIDGVYNDTYLENDTAYNDSNRDWDADA